MIQSWHAIIPPAIVIISAIVTQRIIPSLSMGIITASIVATKGNIGAATTGAILALYNTATNIDNLYLYSFLLCIGILVSLFSATGFAVSFAQAVTHRIKSARQAEYSSITVSLLLFIDDYLSILTTGYVMSPLTDRFKIAREKLAFLVHSFSGSIVILAPVSSWVATIIAYIEQAGVSPSLETKSVRIVADPFFIYLKSLPFMMYSFLTIASVLYIVQRKISYGPMRACDLKAQDNPVQSSFTEGSGSARTLLIPLAVLVGGIAFGLPFAGGYYLFGGSHSLIDSLKYNDHPFLVMLLSVLAAICVTIGLAMQKQVFSRNQIWPTVKEGASLMFEAIAMVFLASTLSGMLANQVGTGQYLASLLIGSAPLGFLPAMFFAVSLISTIATGSAWGNFALMIPIAIPMLTTLSGLPLPIDPQSLPLLLPTLGAIFSGSVCGDHISPISETTIMTATSTGTKPLTHAYTQFFYMLPAVLSSFVSFIALGLLTTYFPYWANIGFSAGTGLIITLSLISLLNRK